MIPTLTPQGVCAALVAAAALAAGHAVGSWPLAYAGGGVLLVLGIAYVSALPLPRAVRTERLEFAWYVPFASPYAVTPRVPFEVRCSLRNRTARTFRLARVGVLCSPGVSLRLPAGACVTARSGERVNFALGAEAQSGGRHFLYGLTLLLVDRLGLVQVHLYFPSTLAVPVFPRPAAGRRLPARPLTGSPLDRAGRHFLSLSGSGTELREIREHRAGDPFRAIDWKATARIGRLMVREHESEVQATHYVIIDSSATMRSGELGRRKLDYAVEAACAFARLALNRGDRVGLVAFDTRITAHVPPGEGRTQFLRLVERLVGLFDPVDEDLTDLTDAELADAVARRMRHQDGVKLSVGAGEAAAPMPETLATEVSRLLGPARPQDRLLAGRPVMAELRRYCRSRGVPVPYRGESPFDEKTAGLSKALAAAGSSSQRVHSLFLVSDLEGLSRWDVVEHGLRLAGLPRRPLLVLVPFAVGFAAEASVALDGDVRFLLELDQNRRLRVLTQRLRRAGARVIAASPEEMPALLYAKAARRARGLTGTAERAP